MKNSLQVVFTPQILMLSSDLDVVGTEPSQASVRARWRTKLIATLNLQGYWEGRIRRMVVRNTQSHVFKLEIVERGGSNRVVKSVTLPRRVYENALDVMEEIVTQLRNITVGIPEEVYSVADLSGEKIYLCNFDVDSHKEYSVYYPVWKTDGAVATFTTAGNVYANYDDITPYTVMKELLDSMKMSPIQIFWCVKFPRSHFHDMLSGIRAVPASFLDESDGSIVRSGKFPKGYFVRRMWGVSSPYIHTYPNGGNLESANIELQDSTRGVKRIGKDTIILLKRLIDFLQLRSTAGVVVVEIENSQYALLKLKTQFTTMSGDIMRINTARNNALFGVKETPVINTFKRVAGTQNVSLSIDNHWQICLKDENDVEKLNGHQFIIRQDELLRWRDTEEHLLKLKMDEIDVFIPELKMANTELSAMKQNLQKSGKAKMMLERNKLVDCIAIPREEEFFVFNGNRRSFKPIFPERGISQLTVELRSTGDKDKSPWFHTGVTLVEIELKRNWSLHREERE